MTPTPTIGLFEFQFGKVLGDVDSCSERVSLVVERCWRLELVAKVISLEGLRGMEGMLRRQVFMKLVWSLTCLTVMRGVRLVSAAWNFIFDYK